MKTSNLILLSVLASFLALCTHAQSAEWVQLFDGKTLNGWIQKNGTATYRAENDTIVGKTTEGSPNSFLCTTKDYGNFELEFDVKVADPLNSGVQLRSQTKDGPTGRVNGPQVEIAAGPGLAGYIYGEATGHDWLTPKEKLVQHDYFKNGQWNHYRVVAQGPRFQTWINGHLVNDSTHEGIYKTHPKGFIGLQVHGIAAGTGPYEVAWRNIRIKELP